MTNKHNSELQEDGDPARSQSSHSFQRIRTDIINGRHAPGERLKIAELAAALNVSPGAVREALSRLSSEQLVISRDQRGFTVAPLSLDDLQDLTDLRCEIEEIAVRRSVARGDVEWEAGILASAHRLQSTPLLTTDPSPTVSTDWLARHTAFHAALVSACGNKRLLALHASLFEQAERYRGLSSSNAGRAGNIAREHQELVDAALARDADRLVDLLLSHLRKTADFIIAKTLAMEKGEVDAELAAQAKTRRAGQSV
ncbi:MAG: FCD domain-containing protein [Pseudomonadota bacterium]